MERKTKDEWLLFIVILTQDMSEAMNGLKYAYVLALYYGYTRRQINPLTLNVQRGHIFVYYSYMALRWKQLNWNIEYSNVQSH